MTLCDESDKGLHRTKSQQPYAFQGVLHQKVPLPRALSCSEGLAITEEGIVSAIVHYFAFRMTNLNLYFPICVKQ